MGKLFYNIYSNITDRQFLKIDKKLNSLKYRMSKVLFQHGWQQLSEKDGLGMAYAKKYGIMKGSISLVFVDLPHRVTFYFGVSKCFDEIDHRYCLGDDIFEEKEFSFFENNIEEFTNLALEKCNSWNKEDILKLGKKVDFT